MTAPAPAQMSEDDDEGLDLLIFGDTLLTETQAAKAYGLAVEGFRKLVREGRGPWTLWAEDVRRGARAHKAGGPSTAARVARR